MLKFGRTYSMRIQTKDGFVEVRDPLTLDFAVRRHAFGSCGTGHFVLYNLAESTRRQIYKDAMNTGEIRNVELRAGYGTTDPLIFTGNIKEAKTYRPEGSVNVLTEISAFDGGLAFANGFSSWAVNGPTTRHAVVTRLVADLSRYGVQPGAIAAFPGTYPRGRSVCGPTTDLLSQETGNRFFIDNGRAYCLKDDDTIAGDIPVISSDTGLLGSPKRADAVIQCELLFEPRFVVGQEVELISSVEPRFNGIYKIWSFDHYGTISGAVGGKLKTVVSLWVGDRNFSALQGLGAFA